MTAEGSARTTRQQRAVRDLLDRTGEFRSAQELHALLHAGGDRIGLATVYRALGRLAETDEVDVLVGPDGEARYRSCRSDHHHHHLVCRSCGTTVEVEAPEVESWAGSVARVAGFTDISHTVEVFGLCADCSKA